MSEKSPGLRELLELADAEALLLNTPDGREFILSEVDDFGHEIEQIRNNPELLAFLAERSREKETFSLEDVKRKLGL
ncbi:MAG: hypothetical protein M3495_04015 [Pseudomonadota bacterium]|nr:hypothetical protein [Gammaproteobacteria bacterium]MDQ3580823.1 hypothetical protein [Pseudomonadota bacterium]